MPTPLKFRTVLLRSARLMSDQVNALLLPHQLNYSLWQVMYVLQARQGCTSIEIAQYLNVSKPSIAKRMHTLNQLGLLQYLNSADKREKKVMLSLDGQHLFALCAAEIDVLEQRVLHGIDDKQLQQSLDLLHQLIQQLESSVSGDVHA
jgi:DNA-binding MarR family transcriptional regulator